MLLSALFFSNLSFCKKSNAFYNYQFSPSDTPPRIISPLPTNINRNNGNVQSPTTDLPILSLRGNSLNLTDTLIDIKGKNDSISFISLNRNIRSGQRDPDDRISPYATTPTSWATGLNIPVFRIRHPYSFSADTTINTSLQRDFKIYPYQYGMAIDYSGVVECWVGEWSIHRGLNYKDTEGNGNGWGAVLWVGDDNDLGGVRATARNNLPQGGNVQYGELSVEKFNGDPIGDFRFRLPSASNEFQFVYGGRGSQHVIAKISGQGFTIPKVASQDLQKSAERGQLVFDSTSNTFKGFNGTKWISINENNFTTGSAQATGDGITSTFKIMHNLGVMPRYYNIVPTSQSAANFSYITSDCTSIFVHYTTAPAAGSALSWNWIVRGDIIQANNL